MLTEPHCVQKRETGVVLGDMVIKEWMDKGVDGHNTVHGRRSIGKHRKNTGHCTVGFQNGQMSLFKSPILVHNVHHYQYKGGRIHQTGSSDCADHSQKLNLISVTKGNELGHILHCPQ